MKLDTATILEVLRRTAERPHELSAVLGELAQEIYPHEPLNRSVIYWTDRAPSYALNTGVARFMKEHDLRIDPRRAHDFRPVDIGTYTHKNLPLGHARDGITDGIHAYMLWSDGIMREVMLENLNFRPDSKAGIAQPKKIDQFGQRAGRVPTAKKAKTFEEMVQDLF